MSNKKNKNIVVISSSNSKQMAMDDLLRGFSLSSIWWKLSIHEVKQKFRRTVLGPFWLTLSLSIMIATITMIRSQLLESSIKDILPVLTTGMIFWTLFSSIIAEGARAFIGARGQIRSIPVPLSIYMYKIIAQNIIVWGHNMIVYLAVFIFFFPLGNLYNYFIFPFGLAIFIINSSSLGLILGIICARFRDIPQIISAALRVLFFATPIFWSVSHLKVLPAFIQWNPLYHLIELVRSPLIGVLPELSSWIIVVSITVFNLFFSIYLYRRFYARIPYWL